MARITGTFLNDRLNGTIQSDMILGLGGNDTLSGRAGNDQLFGDFGNDLLLGGSGDDSLFGENGNDTLIGDQGRDMLVGGEDNDSLVGDLVLPFLIVNPNGSTQDLNDTLSGGQGNDTLLGGQGDDNLVGGQGRDILDGGQGNDSLMGDFVFPFTVNLNGFNGSTQDPNDSLLGGSGNDTLFGGSGDDTLTGADPDNLNPGRGEIDTLTGGSENDLYVLGDNIKVFYDDGSVTSLGINDYGLITDFVSDINEQDKIQLAQPQAGSQYSLGAVPNISGTGIYLNQGGFGGLPLSTELIGVVQGPGAATLNLSNPDQFVFV